MAIEIVVPRLGWSMEEGVFAQWLKADGEWVNAGDALFVLEADKATEEIESFDAGILCIPPDAPKPGDDVKVGQVLGFLIEQGEPRPTTVVTSPQPISPAMPSEQAQSSNKSLSANPLTLPSPPEGERGCRMPATQVTRADGEVSSELPRAARVSISPRAKRLASELGIDWTQVKGTGRGGQVREEDIRAAGEYGRDAETHGEHM